MYKKILCRVILINVCAAISVFASETNLMPPPVSIVNWHKHSGVLNLQGIYLSMKPTDDQYNSPTIDGAGLAGDLNVAFSDKWGMNMTLSYIGMTGKSEDTYSRQDLTMGVFNFNMNGIFELVGGEKKNIAGEITEDGFSWSVFAGWGRTMMSMDIAQKNKSTGNAQPLGPLGSMDITMGSINYGTLMEIPLAFWISIVPNYYVTKYTSMEINGKSVSGFKSPAQTVYGADILVRPLKLNPNLKISLGMLMGLVDANSDTSSGYKSTLIVFGIQYEWGKHYSSVLFHPGIAR